MAEGRLTQDQESEAYSAQAQNLGLKPWEEPPCVMDTRVPVRGTESEARMMKLLRLMLSRGISRWHPDPLAALAEANTKGGTHE
jgi:hypothetical protein